MPSVLPAISAADETFEQFLRVRKNTGVHSDESRLRAAYAQVKELYGEQMHWTGESSLEHCLGVLEVFANYDPDDDGVIACLFHHALEEGLWSLEDLAREQGEVVRSIVSGVHLLGRVSMSNTRMSIGNMRLMFVRVSDDIRVVVLLLCDHMYKLRRMHSMTPERRKQICRDVLELYAPVATRIGMYALKNEMEQAAFPVLYSTDAARIAEQLTAVHKKYGDFLPKVSAMIEEFLAKEGVPATVTVREKKPYSIFKKMNRKSQTHVEDLYDLFAIRVIVPTDTACYQTLGLLHRVGHPVANRFKDYISFPKPNGYKSLHTTLARVPEAPDDVFIEVQIRTEEMQREAERGLAAHWSYKEGGSSGYAAKRAELQKALSVDMLEDSDAHESDHIFVLTPKGDIVELVEGATPLDFAFHVHTDVGLTFRAAKVNGSIAPLQYQLENGDIVEILRNKEPHPSPNWMNVLHTSSARSRLKRYLASQDRPTYIQRGREAFNKELVRKGLPVLDPDLSLLRMIDGQKCSLAAREDFLMKIGQGAHTAFSTFSRVDALVDHALRTQEKKQAPVVQQENQHLEVHIEGTPMPYRFARCCKADEQRGGSIEGVIGRDGMVRIHRNECKLLRHVNPERRVSAHWQ